MARKLRKDSTFARMDADLLHEIDDRLWSNKHSLADIRHYLDGQGIKISEQSISEYWRNHGYPGRIKQLAADITHLSKLDSGSMRDAAQVALHEKTLRIITDPNQDPKLIKTFYDLMLKDKALNNDSRKLDLLIAERDEARSLAKKALDHIEQKGLSDEVTQKIQEQLNIM